MIVVLNIMTILLKNKLKNRTAVAKGEWAEANLGDALYQLPREEARKVRQKAGRVYRRLAKEAAAAKESEDAVRAALVDSRKDFNG